MIPDGALLIRDGIIEEVGPSRRLENLSGARDAVEINAAGRVVMPGFIDCHTHLVFPPPGDSDEDLDRDARTIRTGTSKRLTSRTRSYLHAMARHGTTTVEAKTGSGCDDRVEFKLLRVMAALKRDPVDLVPTALLRLPAAKEGPAAIQTAVDWYVEKFLPRVRQRRLAKFVQIVWDNDPALYPALDRCLESARAQGFQCKIHVGSKGSGAAIALGLQRLVVGVDHLEHATEEDTALLAGGRIIATLLPYPSLQRRSQWAPARAMVDAGVPIALASDFNPGHAPNLNMQVVVALACLQMGLTPAEAISAATINGAHVLGCPDRAGSLEPGKAADLLILNIGDYAEMAHHFGTNLVHLTMKRGEFIYKEGDVARRTVDVLHPAW